MELDIDAANCRRLFSGSAVPLMLQGLFSTFSAFFKPSTPGWQIQPAGQPTNVLFFQDTQENCTPQPLASGAVVLLTVVPGGERGDALLRPGLAQPNLP